MQEITKKSLTCSGKGPFPCYRIPGLVVTATGTILAYFEMRVGNSDWSTRGIGLFRSRDGGETWEELQTPVLARQEEAINNPVMIARRNGTVHFFWQTDYRRCYHQVSTNDGESFSTPHEITVYLQQFQKQYPWKVVAFGPGHGIERADGSLLVPVWLANGVDQWAHSPSVAATLLSRDEGVSWIPGTVIGDSVGICNPNESCVFERSDGEVVLNMRHTGKPHYRAVARSSNGLSFAKAVHESSLPDPVCFGSVCRVKNAEKGLERGVVFSNCASLPCRENNFSHARKRLTLRLSKDDGTTWAYSRCIEEYAGYSDIAVSPDGNWIYCFYEHDTDEFSESIPHYLTFAKANLEWLSDGDIV